MPGGKPTRSRSRLLEILTLLTAIFSPHLARAVSPSIEYLFPAGGQQGTTVTLTVGGKPDAKDAKIDPWPAKVWSDCPGLEFKPAEANGSFTVAIAKDCPSGPHLVRVYNEDGPSAPRVFVVGRHPEVLEQEPDDDARKAQVLEKLPTVVNGQLDKANDVDSYAIDVEAGRWIVAEMLCRRINSPVDPAMHLLNPDGVEIAFNHDTFGLDPFIACRAPRSGRYVLQVVGFAYPPGVDVRFAGGKGAAYRLSVTTGPYARYAMPLGVRRGAKTDLTLFGWNLGSGGRSAHLEYDGSALPSRADSIELGVPEIDNSLRLPVADLPQRVEEEPNDDAATQAQHVEAPVAITGRIGRPGDVDRFAFAAKKGEEFAFALASSSLGFPLDAMLRVEDAMGKPLARDDDANGAQDAKIGWTAPADGTYVVAVADQSHRGGDDYVYRLEIRLPTPDFRATADAASVKLELGKSAELKVTVARQGGYAAPLAVTVTGLPDGITASSPAVPAAGGALTVTLAAASTAKTANVPLRVLVVSTDEDHPAARVATVGLPPADQLVTKTEMVWLTVAAGATPATMPASK